MEHPLSAPRHWLAGAAIISSLGVFAPCAHAQDIRTQAARAAAPRERNEFMSAVEQPLADFNINQAEIPDSLRKAAADPYAALAADSCAVMASEIADLDTALGPDLDVDAVKTTKRRMASRAAAGAIRRLSVSWIPMRGIVRTVSGAEAHARKAQDAALAGAVRRAYLKGLGERDGCAGAMPRRVVVDQVAPAPELIATPEAGEARLIKTENLAVPAAQSQVVALTAP